ncbi:carbon-nitrogen family hydrolase [Paenibacillus sambharensis]|uniref:Carbon-nitrogen family hydrolase n=1 Tax=Paenibacillus sambharensis TaxID=1803190 RepID=A0A2W1LEW7_9BACL|nr:carbon-nitrogen family hydrolase [Paenibacillus sambharensis]PZD93585.1 carbon-nitrogen family hydrolase [Paenibacillus sambharensis]
MTKRLKVALLQMDIQAGDPDANFRHVEELLHKAVSTEDKPQLIVLPEMWNTGYALDIIDSIADREGQRTKQMMSAFSREHQVQIVAGSIAEQRAAGGVYNTIHVFGPDGAEAGEYSKIHLFCLMDEEKHLQAGGELGTTEVGGEQAGMMICYDIRFPELARTLALQGAKILIVPAEWPNPRLNHWRTLLTARAIENQMYVIACNRVGTSGGTSFFGHSMVIDPWGDIIAEAGEEETILTAEINPELVTEVRGRIPVFTDRRPDHYRLG